MLTAGIDLASQEAKTALCEIEWARGRAKVCELRVGVSDADIVDCARRVRKLGLDVPLGWPSAFVDALVQHGGGGTWPVGYRHEMNQDYRLRATDRFVHAKIGGNPPLSVSTDRIAIPAMRAAAALSALPEPVARDGSGVVVEVYPAAALRRWDLDSRAYKGKDHQGRRHDLAVALFAASPWLDLDDEKRRLCCEHDDAFDAVVAALIARAVVVRQVETIPLKSREVATREGWIALPRTGSLDRLVSGIGTSRSASPPLA